MSRLEELIAEYCPNGVEYKSIGDLCEVLTGGEAPEGAIKSKEPVDDFIYPIYSILKLEISLREFFKQVV